MSITSFKKKNFQDFKTLFFRVAKLNGLYVFFFTIKNVWIVRLMSEILRILMTVSPENIIFFQF